MAKGFGYKYSEGKVHFTIKYGPIIAGVVVNGEWRRIIFRHVEAAADAIKRLEKAGMYDQFMGHMNKLEEVPDTYFVSLYDVHLAPYIKGYFPSTEKYYDENGGVKVKKKTVSLEEEARDYYYNTSGIRTGRSSMEARNNIDIGRVAPGYTVQAVEPIQANDRIPYNLADYERMLREYPVRTTRITASRPHVPQPWLRGDWAEAATPPEPRDDRVEQWTTTEYPIDRAIENMRGTEQERRRAEQNRQLMEALDRLSFGPPRTGRNRDNL